MSLKALPGPHPTEKWQSARKYLSAPGTQIGGRELVPLQRGPSAPIGGLSSWPGMTHALPSSAKRPWRGARHRRERKASVKADKKNVPLDLETGT
jgi:hypothetical protein